MARRKGKYLRRKCRAFHGNREEAPRRYREPLERFVITHRQNGSPELHRVLRFDLYDATHEVFFGDPFRIVFKEDGTLAGRKPEGLFFLLRIDGFPEESELPVGM